MNGGHPTADDGTPDVFPSRSRLPARSSWWTSVLVVTGAAMMITVSLGDMAGELGAGLTVWVWIGIAAIGAVQCFLIGQLAARFPGRAGGTAQFAYRARPQGSPSLGALSAWCYWLAWTPGIAINLILAGTYLQRTVLPDVDRLFIALVIAVLLYALTALGLQVTSVVNAGLAAVAVVIVGIVLTAPLFDTSALRTDELMSVTPPADPSASAPTVVALVLKWAFIATWVGYAGEMASTVCAEVRDAPRTMWKAMTVSAVLSFAILATVPAVLFLMIGTDGVANDPFDAFVAAGSVVFGASGGTAVGLGLTAVLVLAAEAFIIGSSRTIYQMSSDGHLPRFFARTNGRGAPVGSILWDAVVICVMLAVFGTNVIEVVAAATFGYLVVFVLLPLAYLGLRKVPDATGTAPRRSRSWVLVAVFLLLVNSVLLVVGGSQWDIATILVGVLFSVAILPISALTRRAARRRAGSPPADRPKVTADDRDAA